MIKRVLAYSTVSQLGYMFLACGVGAFSAGIFHIDDRALSSKRFSSSPPAPSFTPWAASRTCATWAASAKKSSTPTGPCSSPLWPSPAFPRSPASSAGRHLLSAFPVPGGHPLYAIGLLTALLTSFYMFRLIFLTFHGQQRYDEHHVHVHESPGSMLGPLVILAVLSVIGGWLAAPALRGGPDYFTSFLAPIFGSPEAAGAVNEAAAHQLELILAVVAVASALIGLVVAFWLYLRQPGKPEQIAKSLQPVYTRDKY